ncbi:MAG: tRNA pseudouridine(38-40) synthase TruA [Anaerolineae bacterium]|nr:tRNA pseudouridine(38-40) synthase TruA [Anaerolineae bacterium]
MKAGVTRYRAVVAYDGTDYFGFQRQTGDTPTIQGAIEAALRQATGQEVAVTGAGRTDTGVHAIGQVIAFDAAWHHTTADLWRAINARLPASIALRSLEEAAAKFHPRFDARSRAYVYTLLFAPVRQPLWQRTAWQIVTSRPPDADVMQRAAAGLVGSHDFAAFGHPPQGESTVREVFRSECRLLIQPEADGVMLRYEIEANAFFYRMVRRIVGGLARVGRGELAAEDFLTAFRAADGAWPNQSAPAHGLCLMRVTY